MCCSASEGTKGLLAIYIPLFILFYLFCLIKAAILLSNLLSGLSYLSAERALQRISHLTHTPDPGTEQQVGAISAHKHAVYQDS